MDYDEEMPLMMRLQLRVNECRKELAAAEKELDDALTEFAHKEEHAALPPQLGKIKRESLDPETLEALKRYQEETQT